MNLRDYLRQHAITQVDFGRSLSPPVSQGKVNHWLNGTRRVSLGEALQIVRITDGKVDLESLARLSAASSDHSHLTVELAGEA